MYQKKLKQNEIKEALELFEMLLTESDYLKDLRNDNAKDIIKQACFISEGFNGHDALYFPNSQFTFTYHKRYRFVCLAKLDYNDFVIIYEYNEEETPKKLYERLKGYNYIVLNDLVFSSEEQEKMRELKNEIKNTTEVVETLQKIKRVKTKSGSDFKIISKNFVLNDRNVSVLVDKYRICLNGNLYIRHHIDNYINITIDEICDAISKEIENKKQYIENKKSLLGSLHQEKIIIEKAIKEFNNKLSEIKNGDLIEKMIRNLHLYK